MNKRVETYLTIMLVLSAMVLATAAVKREFASPNAATGDVALAKPLTFVENWERLSSIGTWIGDSTAKVRIVEFTDFECPFCKRFHEQFREVQDSLGNQVALLVIQFPLTNHRFARPAALAAECVVPQTRRAAFTDILFAKQDSLGLKSWTSYALEAGVSDTVAFAECVAEHRQSALIDSGLAAGERIGVRGTPTVLINGWRYARTPYDSLGAIVRAQLGGVR